MKRLTIAANIVSLVVLLVLIAPSRSIAAAQSPTGFDLNTLAGKVAAVNGTAGLQIRFSSFIEEAAEPIDLTPAPTSPITPTFVLTSPLDATSVAGPAVTVNRDSAAAPQNETAIAVDPNNPNRVVAAANDYVTRTWSCSIGGTPCSQLGDGYSGTYFSNTGGASWCCSSSDPSHLGTLIPGVSHLAGGPYDAGGDPALAFDSRGQVFYAGLGFDRAIPPNTVTVNKGSFNGSGDLSWGAPTFLNPTTSPAIFNDKEWIAADWHVASPFRDQVYVSWTRFIFNPTLGTYVQSPIFFARSSDGGQTFSDPQSIVSNVLYDQGSRVVVGYDGTVYVFWEGSTRLASLNSVWMVKSTDGGANFSKPVAVADLQDILTPRSAAFRVNSFPAADIAPNSDLYVAWSSQTSDTGGPCATRTDIGCHAAALYSKSIDGGATWGSPAPILPAVDASLRTAIGYPVTNAGVTLRAPSPRKVDTFWPAVAISDDGRVYMSAYGADVVSPWQRCGTPARPTSVGRINCLVLGSYIHNARLDYYVADLTTNVSNKVSTAPINTRYGFGGGFFGDYTGLAVGSDHRFHALWTDTNNVENVVWFYGAQFVPTPIHQQDVVTASGSY